MHACILHNSITRIACGGRHSDSASRRMFRTLESWTQVGSSFVSRFVAGSRLAAEEGVCHMGCHDFAQW